MEENGSSKSRPAPGQSRSRRKRRRNNQHQQHQQQAAPPRDARVFRILVALVMTVLVADVKLFASLHQGEDSDEPDDSVLSGKDGNVAGDGKADRGGGSSWSRMGKTYLASSDGGGGDHPEPAAGVHVANLSTEVDDRVRKMVDRAGVTIDAKLASDLPTRDDLTSMYGEDPVIYGLDTCEAYRSAVPQERAVIAPAGMFNSGTNLMAELLTANCKIEKTRANQDPNPRMDFQHAKWRHGMMWQVPWGKHVPAMLRLKHTSELASRFPDINKADVLPVVIVKDPYSWMGSMCRHAYNANWRHSPNHCPNLVRNAVDHRSFRDQRTGPDDNIEVNVRYPFGATHHSSLAGLWNDWYGAYHDATDYPRLVVRYEDLLFQPESVVAKVCHCAGGTVASGDAFRVPSDSAKAKLKIHDKASGLLQALMRYGSPKKRVEGYTADDLRYARTHIREDLMDAYGYVFPP